jgi:hypothetical protein
MNDSNSNRPLSDLDAYLDGLLEPARQRECVQRAKLDVSFRAELELQQQIELELRRRFQVPPVPPLAAQISGRADEAVAGRNGTSRPIQPNSAQRASRPAAQTPAHPVGWQRWLPVEWTFPWQLAGLGALAAIAWLAVAWALVPSESSRAEFRPRPLAVVYRETVRNGFQPLYAGTEADRIRDTFYHRHGQALKLGKLPEDCRVEGLSYVPSVSQHSTAILARVQNQPVMLFVDKLARDAARPPTEAHGLRIYRAELNELVIYEVTPLHEPRLISLLLPTDPPPDACLVD